MPLFILRRNEKAPLCGARVVPAEPFSGKIAPQRLEPRGATGYGCSMIEYAPDKPTRTISAFVPCWDSGKYAEQSIIASCYETALTLALRWEIDSIELPLLCSGNVKLSDQRLLDICVQVCEDFLKKNDISIYIAAGGVKRNEGKNQKGRIADIKKYLKRKLSDEAECEYSLPKSEISPRPPKSRINQDFMSMHARYEAEYQKSTKRVMCLEDYLHRMEDGFADTLFAMIDEKGISDVECYKRANVDKKVFSKIKCNKNYKPSKATALAFAIALELDLEKTKKLLGSAGLALSHSSKFDMIIEYFIVERIYDINTINEALYEFDQVLLGL